MKVLVTGGAGFIGSHLVERLVASGHEVTVVDDLSLGCYENLKAIHGKFTFRKGNLESSQLADRVCEGQEVVFHLAAHSGVAYSMNYPAKSFRAGPLLTLNVLEGARRAGVRRVIFASSSSVYGGVGPYPQEETQTPAPQSHYAFGKWIGEQYAEVYRRESDMEITCLRYFNVFGPRQRCDPQSPAFVPAAMKALCSNLPVMIYGDGEQSRDWTYVKSVAGLTERVMDAETLPTVVNVCHGGSLSVLGILRLLEIENHVFAGKERPGDVRKTQGSTARMMSTVGPFFSTLARGPRRDALQDTKEWYLERWLADRSSQS